MPRCQGDGVGSEVHYLMTGGGVSIGSRGLQRSTFHLACERHELWDHALSNGAIALLQKCVSLAASRHTCESNIKFMQAYDPNYYLFTHTDECVLNTDGCAQICTNIIGSYCCSCRPGHTLTSNRCTCQGTCITDYSSALWLQLGILHEKWCPLHVQTQMAIICARVHAEINLCS